MYLKLVLVSVLFSATSVQAHASAYTYCTISDGEAKGNIYSDVAQDIKGKGKILFLNAVGEVFKSSDSISISTSVSSQSSKTLMSLFAPSEAKACIFSIEAEADIGSGGSWWGDGDGMIPIGISYKHQCAILEDPNYLWSHIINTGNSVILNRVKILFFSQNNQNIKTVDSVKNICLKEGQKINFDHIEIPVGAVNCKLEIFTEHKSCE